MPDTPGVASWPGSISALLRLPALRSGSPRRRQAGWAQLAANLFPIVGVLLFHWSFAEMLLVFFVETALFVLLAPSQFSFQRPALAVIKVLGWYVGWCLIFYIHGLMGLGVSTIAESERFIHVKGEFGDAFNVMITGSVEQSPTIAEFWAHPIAASMIAVIITAALSVRRDTAGPARRLVPECWARAAYFHVGLCYCGIALFFVIVYAPALGAAFLTVPLVILKILADARE